MCLKNLNRALCAAVTLAATLFGASGAMASECAATIESNDAMQFNVKSMVVPKACKSFSVTLKHVGKLPKAAMGHNWVLTKSADMAATAKDGIAAGVSNHYLKPQDTRVIASTPLIGGGESSTIEFAVDKLSATGDYSFFCSFPGHSALMKGSLKLGS